MTKRSKPDAAEPLHTGIPPERYDAAKQKLSRRFLSAAVRVLNDMPRAGRHHGTPNPLHNVVGVGIGSAVVNGRRTGRRVIKIFVRRKYAPDDILPHERLPASIDGIPIDVEEIGTIRASQASPRATLRPAFPGCSIGWFSADSAPMAGTMGALVRDRTNATFLLSANHVIAAENRLAIGAPILQPGTFDGGDPAKDRIAVLERFVPLTADTARLDCAIARTTGPVDPRIIGVGAPSGVATAADDMAVKKFGRSTLLTTGTIVTVNTDFLIDYEHLGTVTMEGQIGIQGLNGADFGDSGDSGALIVETQGNAAVGLLIGNSAGLTVANHLVAVMNALSVALVTTG